MRATLTHHFFLMIVAVSCTSATALAGDCANAASQQTMNKCADKAYRQSDAELNHLYGQIVRRLKGDAATTKLLKVAQQAWIAYRDAECDFAVSGAAAGSIYPMLHAQCADVLTTSRVSDFKKYLSCQESDMSCPVRGP